MRNYVTPGKSNSVRFEPRGVWNATVVRVDVGSNEAWVRVPRMSGDLDRGPLQMPSLAAPLAVGDDVLVAFREGKADQLAIVAKVGASEGGGGGSSYRYATVVVAAADSLHSEDADVVCTGTNDDVTIQQIFADALDAGMSVRVLLMEGTFSLDDQGLSLDQDGSVLEGQGAATRLLFTKPNVYIGLFGSNTAVRNLVCVDEMESQREGLQEGWGTFVELSGNRTSVTDCMFDCFRMDRAIYSYGLDTQIVNNTIYGSFGIYDSARSAYGIRIDSGIGTIVAGNTIRMVLPPGWYNDSAGISIWAGKAVCSHNWVHVAFPEESDVEDYPWAGAQAQTIWVRGDAITVTGNYAYGWFEDGTWVEFDDTAVIWADSGDGGLISGNVCDGNVAAGANYANTIVLNDPTDGWQVTSNNLWPEYNNGVGTVGSYGYDAVVFGNNPDAGQLDFVSLGGDLGNVLSNASVIRLYGRDLSSAAPATNEVLLWDGSQWEPGTPSSPWSFVFGSGVDGAVTLDYSSAVPGWATAAIASGVRTFTLQRDVYCTNLTVSGSVQIFTNSFKIFCSGVLSIGSGVIVHNDGQNASGATGGGYSSTSTSAQTFRVGMIGQNGSTGAAPSQSTNNESAACNDLNAGINSSGGAGGSSTGAPGSGGGTAGQTVSMGANRGSPNNVLQATLGLALGAASASASGSNVWGGGGCGNAGTGGGLGNTGGGGGGGAGVVGIYARTLSNNGTIRAKGGDGGNAVTTAVSPAAGGGGGGGGGGIILVYEATGSTVGSTDVSGGTGGSGVGTGKSGENGYAGKVWSIAL